MEIFEQLRLLLILVMAFLSYQYVGNQPLSLTASEDEEEENFESEIPIEPDHLPTNEQQNQEIQEEPQNSDGFLEGVEEREEVSHTHSK